MPSILEILPLIRPDLKRLYRNNGISTDLYFWLINAGRREYKLIINDGKFIGLLNRKFPYLGCSLSILQCLIWISRRDIQKQYPLPKMEGPFIEWFHEHGVKEHDLYPFLPYICNQDSLPKSKSLSSKFLNIKSCAIKMKKEFNEKNGLGVNLIGHALGQLGIGEDLRMASNALSKAYISHCILNFQAGKDIPLILTKGDINKYIQPKGEYFINIFCITAEETARFYAERGTSQFRGHYNIGYWPWELSKWPQEWRMLLSLVDEIWVSTKHTYDALKKVYKGPLFLMPMAVHLGKIGISTSINKIREHFSLPKNAKLFCFSFDLNSSIYRKNPQGCVKAFLEAFPKKEFPSSEVGLVIKTHKPKGTNKNWQQLKRLASKDDRIHIIEDTLTREDLLALYKACDCFLSLHRAEGFGRGIAEALQLGLHVITTGYSGNVDFCKKTNADLVDYKLIKVGPGQYPRSNNQVWADPDISHAASLIKKFALKRQKVKPIKTYPQFSPQVVGKRYQKRLQEIMKILKKSPKLAHPLSK